MTTWTLEFTEEPKRKQCVMRDETGTIVAGFTLAGHFDTVEHIYPEMHATMRAQLIRGAATDYLRCASGRRRDPS
jgi:hypothetical protein